MTGRGVCAEGSDDTLRHGVTETHLSWFSGPRACISRAVILYQWTMTSPLFCPGMSREYAQSVLGGGRGGPCIRGRVSALRLCPQARIFPCADAREHACTRAQVTRYPQPTISLDPPPKPGLSNSAIRALRRHADHLDSLNGLAAERVVAPWRVDVFST